MGCNLEEVLGLLIWYGKVGCGRKPSNIQAYIHSYMHAHTYTYTDIYNLQERQGISWDHSESPGRGRQGPS